MDFAALQVFKAVVEEGGISPAARKLHRVQSNVTTRIQGNYDVRKKIEACVCSYHRLAR